MDMRISPGGARADVIASDTAPRVTPKPGAPFRDMVARGAGAIVRGAEAAVSALPGAPIVAAAVRGGRPVTTMAGPGAAISGGMSPVSAAGGTGTAESPGAGAGVGGAGGAGGEATSVEQTLQQTQEFNLYYLQLQEQLAAENRSYSAMSNVLKARHDTVKNAIGNIR